MSTQPFVAEGLEVSYVVAALLLQYEQAKLVQDKEILGNLLDRACALVWPVLADDVRAHISNIRNN